MEAPLGFDFLHWRALTVSAEEIKAAPNFLQRRLFKRQPPLASDTVDIEMVKGNDRIYPFVSDVSGGTVVRKTSREAQTVKCGRIRPKKDLPANVLLGQRAAGQPVYISGVGDVNKAAQQRVAQETADLKNGIDLTIEWMCAEALTGELVVDQEDVKFSVDYRFPDGHNPALTGTAVWGGAAGDIPANIETWAGLIRTATKRGPDLMLLGSNAASKFTSDAKVVAEMNNRRIEAGALKLDVTSDLIGIYKGLEVWHYPFQREIAAGKKVLLPTNACCLVNTQARFPLFFGCIRDIKAGLVMSEYFSKTWLEEDPSVLWLTMESRPMPVIGTVGSVVYATVLE